MNRKTHYQVLGLPASCTPSEIQHSFHRLSNLHHPDKNPDDRLTAQFKFNQICEAFFTLSNSAIRSDYDQLLIRPSLDTALNLLLRFFQENGFQNQFQRDDFNRLYPDREPTYYQVLGVFPNASQVQIQRAFRKLSIVYNPKNHPGDKGTETRFIKICAAYNQLHDDFRRSVYDDYMFGGVNSGYSLCHFNRYIRDNPFGNKEDQQFFMNLMRRESGSGGESQLPRSSSKEDHKENQMVKIGEGGE